MHFHRARRFALLAGSGLWIVCGACSSTTAPASNGSQAGSGNPSTGETDASAAPAGTLDDEHIESAAIRYAQDGWSKMNHAAFETQQHAGNPMVNVYANQTAESTYREIQPMGTPKGAFAFPAGSILVKEMLGANGAPDVLTVMYKKTPGYDSTHDDWWYGRLGTDGVPTNPAYAGKVDFCVDCHSGTAEWDYVWGAGNVH